MSGYTYVGVGSAVSAFNAAVAPTPPAGIANGDLLLLFAYEYMGIDVAPVIAGWTKLSPNVNASGCALYGRLSTGADGASHTWSTGWHTAWIAAYRGAPGVLAGIVNASADRATTSTNTVVTNTAAVTPTVDNCLVIAAGARDKTVTANGATFGAFSDGSFTTRQTNTMAGTAPTGIFADCLQTTATAIAANNSSLLSITDTAAAAEGFIVVLLPNTNVTGTSTTGQGETAHAVAGIAVTGVVATAQGESVAAVGSWGIFLAGTGATAQGESVSSGGNAPLPGAGTYSIFGGMPDNVDSTTLTFRVTYGLAYVDRTIFITKAKAGDTGGSGVGTPGVDALTGSVTNDTFMVMCYAEGTPVDPTFFGDDGYFTVASGATDVTAASSLSIITTNCVATVNTADNTPVPAHAKGYYKLTDISADNATLTLRALYKGQQVSTPVSAFKAKGGYQIVSSLPSSNLFEGRVVYLLTDHKLYRYDGAKWTAEVPALDITGLLQDAQIASLAASKVTGVLTNDQVTAIDASKILGQLTAAQILASGQGACLSDDPYFKDDTSWIAWGGGYPLPTYFNTVGGPGGTMVASGPSTATIVGLRGIPVNQQKSYRVSAWLQNYTSTDGAFYLRVSLRDWNNVELSVLAVGVEGVTQANDNVWRKYAGFFTPGIAPLAAPGAVLNYSGSAGSMAITDLRIEEVVGGDMILAGSLTATNIAAASITGDKIAARTIAAASMVAGSLTAGEIAAGAITATQLAAGSVVAGKIAAGTIQAADIAANTITGAKIAASTIIGTNILGATITGDKMDAGAIITATAQITDGIIIGAKIGTAQINTAHIQDLAVGTLKIAGHAVTQPLWAANTSNGSLSGTSQNTLLTITITTTGAPLLILAGGIFELSNAVFPLSQVQIYRDTTLLTERAVNKLQYGHHLSVNDANWLNLDASFHYIEQPAAGTYTYTLQVYASDPTYPVTWWDIGLFIIECKK